MDKPAPSRLARFWHRQFGPERTTSQVVFDILFGIVAPILCLTYDPIVFRSFDTCSSPWLPELQAFVYGAVGLGTGVLAMWLTLSQRLAFASGVLTGVFIVGAVLAGGIGVRILPASLFGLLLLCLGALGFIPFFTAFVYWRNGVRAWQMAREYFASRGRIGLWVMFFVGIVISIGLPVVTQQFVGQFTMSQAAIVVECHPNTD